MKILGVRASGFMLGAGGQLVWIDPDSDAVVVSRRLDGAHSLAFVRCVVRANGSDRRADQVPQNVW